MKNAVLMNMATPQNNPNPKNKIVGGEKKRRRLRPLELDSVGRPPFTRSLRVERDTRDHHET